MLFLFCFAILFGPAYALFDSYNYDLVANPDLRTYLGLANFEFDQNETRKYRVIIPFLAAGVNYVFGPFFSVMEPHTFPGPDFSLCLSFLLVNCTCMALFGVLVYRLCKANPLMLDPPKIRRDTTTRSTVNEVIIVRLMV